MKRLILAVAVAVLLIAVVSPAVADTLLSFKDGAANEVWQSIERVGNRYCTVKEYLGTYCVNVVDVKAIKKVPAGTQASEYSISTGGVDGGNADLGAILNKSEAEDRAFKARRDREQAARAKADQKRVDRNRREGKADWAQ